ncbi:galactose-1-phosphate uridylyltransferase [Stieleria varia]|uniref:Galactose-1-phosphate uridylyltransferase n=1 Tax=Stieleria varia TaxID=2528005 RepID=A0A5C6B9Q2_9BACT|nr:DUF4921 family protein [Stieleria varia]TWU08049.1 Galactose-1-phosphate uridylyltransferase [Stieleria varia]
MLRKSSHGEPRSKPSTECDGKREPDTEDDSRQLDQESLDQASLDQASLDTVKLRDLLETTSLSLLEETRSDDLPHEVAEVGMAAVDLAEIQQILKRSVRETEIPNRSGQRKGNEHNWEQVEQDAHSRRDLITGDWTIFAPQRDERPNEYRQLTSRDQIAEASAAFSSSNNTPTHLEHCPFCAGAELKTPTAVWSGKVHADPSSSSSAWRIVNGEQDDWDVRVVPNKFPAVISCDSDDTQRNDFQGSKWFPIESVAGGHEVFVESRDHVETLTQVDPASVALLLAAYRDRMDHYRICDGVKYISVFKNCGPDAGASLSHTHSQLIATTVLPSRVRNMVRRMQNHRASSGCCLQCDLLRAEIADSRRVVAVQDGLIAYCPFASRLPGFVRVTQTKHNSFFEKQSDRELTSLAELLVQLIHALTVVHPGAAYNYVINTFPPADHRDSSFHWSLDLFPRLTKTAGFEWGSDCIINPLLPETAAGQYRQQMHSQA